jgi:SOUL heme-binding protein
MFTPADESTTNAGGTLAALLIHPVATGMRFVRAATRRRILADGLTAIGLGMLQVELARWFTSELAFDLKCKTGDFELRHYPTSVEACTQIDDSTLAPALDHGYGRLASYICGANRTNEVIERMMPIFATMQDGVYTVSFAMPPGRALEEFPQPEHPGVELRKVAAREIAALRFRGPITADNLAAHQAMLQQQLQAAGRAGCGSVTFASFHGLTTLPILRRNELWLEVNAQRTGTSHP